MARCDGREIGSHHLSPALQGAGEDRAGSALIPGATLDEIEREAILRTLEEVGGSTARAAQILGIGRPPQQGVDSWLLIRRDGRWWIAAATNEVVTPDRPIPPELRPEARRSADGR